MELWAGRQASRISAALPADTTVSTLPASFHPRPATLNDRYIMQSLHNSAIRIGTWSMCWVRFSSSTASTRAMFGIAEVFHRSNLATLQVDQFTHEPHILRVRVWLSQSSDPAWHALRVGNGPSSQQVTALEAGQGRSARAEPQREPGSTSRRQNTAARTPSRKQRETFCTTPADSEQHAMRARGQPRKHGRTVRGYYHELMSS